MKNFVLIGAAGYVAPRHMEAIKATGNQLIAALDKNDSVGIIDSYFPEAAFFTEFERFDRHLEKLKRSGVRVDYVSICSPNYLHDAHCRFGLRHGADVICEKPLVINPWNLEGLRQIEQETNKKIYTILQLRLHPAIIELKRRVATAPSDKTFEVDLNYITARGKWYLYSWKGDEAKSGGIVTNIGIHFFDALIWVFGVVKAVEVYSYSATEASGYLELERARVKWFLSIDVDSLPEELQAKGGRRYRSLKIEGEELEFSGGFEDLHISSYQSILAGSGFGIDNSFQAIDLVYKVRNSIIKHKGANNG